MNFIDIFYPTREEREVLGRFYLSSFVSEITNVVLPFQFIFLVLVMDRPEWAIVPLIVEGLVVFLFEIPTGMIADRYGRKISVVLGDILSGIAWMSVPLALLFHGPMQLVIVCLAFSLDGLGQTLVSGAEEAWVMDNLIARKKSRLSDQYFAREKSVSSLGGVISGCITWILLTLSPATTEIIVGLWIVAGAGQALSALIQLAIPEHRVSASRSDTAGEDVNLWQKLKTGEARQAFGAILTNRALLAFCMVILITSFATSVTDDAFEISMVTNGLNPKELAPLAVLTDLVGFGTPLVAVILSRWMGPFNFLFLLLVIPLLAIMLLFTAPALIVIVGLYLFFELVDDLWDPIADAVMHSYISSSTRATTTSIINQASELISLGGLSVFALMLGAHSEKVEEAIPDIIEAFQGVQVQALQMPAGIFGIPVQDSALVLFTLIGAVAAPVIVLFPWMKETRQVTLPDLTDGQELEMQPEKTGTEVPPQLHKRLVKVRKGLDALLGTYNPGEELSWNVSDDAFELPADTLAQLEEMGPALNGFFAAANKLFYRHGWIRERLEKKMTPHYGMLNRCQPDAVPRLLRPDIVCDMNWVPKLVELEITVGARADTSVMARQYGLDLNKSLIASYSEMAKEYERQGKNLALVTAPHPFFLDLPDDARAFASMLRESGVNNLSVITDENLYSLRFDGEHLWLCERFEEPRIIHVIDRFIDMYEIAELQHAGIGAILDAYLAGALVAINTVKQFLDEKDWMSLFWDPRLKEDWLEELGPEQVGKLQNWITKTWIVTRDLMVRLNNGEEVPITDIGQVKPELRTFIIKESGTSTTASGSQSFRSLVEMSAEDVNELVEKILESEVEHVLQELIESPRISYHDIDPDTDETAFKTDARFKLSPFYIDGRLSDIRFVASNRLYAVNDDEHCVVGVVRRP